ncbi:GGDEF domain-containing protein [Massilia sp. PAMC28688]|uniref:GGDEF domain-containing protein n=1 Tax=Massilia sp. PAMC28688 TaxID=2861283 RepID=UPI001E4D1CFF|nr:GGDEF domain-containing protein [Massilia sp. PAMC28688]
MEQTGIFAQSTYTIDDLQLFQDCDHGALAPLLANCAILRLADGELLEDSARARLFIVLSGALAVSADVEAGAGDGVASRILPGESAGEQAVLDDSANLSAMAAVGSTELLVIDAELVWTLIDKSGGLARNLLRMLSFRVRAANAQLRRGQKLGEFYRKMSMNDGLTGLYNRTWLADMLPKMVATAQRAGTPLSLLMIDLDHFKTFNDTHGHLTGDDALRAAAGVVGVALRPSDFAVRYGGEEMMVLLPETSELLAVMVAERLVARMRETMIFPDMRQPLPHITASVGVAVLAEGMDDLGLIAAADAALYRAKNGGRDQVAL